MTIHAPQLTTAQWRTLRADAREAADTMLGAVAESTRQQVADLLVTWWSRGWMMAARERTTP